MNGLHILTNPDESEVLEFLCEADDVYYLERIYTAPKCAAEASAQVDWQN